MPLDPTDPGAVAIASIILTPDELRDFDYVIVDHSLTPEQMRRYNLVIAKHQGTLRLDLLSEGWVRVSQLGPTGDAIDEDTYLAPG